MDSLPCREPFDQAPSLCRVCRLVPVLQGARRCSRVVVESPSMQALMVRAAAIAAADAPILIEGETGVGKEVLARILHANSPCQAKPFVAVNVAALPAELLESELFGHVRGAFTGATSDREGLFRAADGGTLLLDEIGEMPLSLQAKLLRVLQDGEVRPVGEVRSVSVKVRILCATNQELRTCVDRRQFREDLYYRLRVFRLTVPPLRERIQDILPLAEHFLELENHPTRRFSAQARLVLRRHSWPGNVRELANAVKHGAVLSRGQDVDVAHLPEDVVSEEPRRSRSPSLRSLAVVEREHVLSVLETCGGNQVEAARILGIGRTTLWRLLRRGTAKEPRDPRP